MKPTREIRPDPAVRLLLAPILVRQGKRVRRTALKLPEPEGPRRGKVGTGPTLRLLIVGDSSAAGVGVATQDLALSGRLAAKLAAHYAVEWALIAKTGATTRSTLQSLQSLRTGDRTTYDIAVVAVGVNDVTAGVALKEWLSGQRQLWDLLIAEYGVTRIYVTGFPPVRELPLLPQPLRWFLGRQAEHFDRQLRRAAATRPEVTYVTIKLTNAAALIADDGFHPGPEIYDSWSTTLAEVVLGRFPRAPMGN